MNCTELKSRSTLGITSPSFKTTIVLHYNIVARHQFLDKTAITKGHHLKMAKAGACERCSMVYYLAYPAVIPNSKQLHIPWENLIIDNLLNIGVFMQWIIASLAC